MEREIGETFVTSSSLISTMKYRVTGRNYHSNGIEQILGVMSTNPYRYGSLFIRVFGVGKVSGFFFMNNEGNVTNNAHGWCVVLEMDDTLSFFHIDARKVFVRVCFQQYKYTVLEMNDGVVSNALYELVEIDKEPVQVSMNIFQFY